MDSYTCDIVYVPNIMGIRNKLSTKKKLIKENTLKFAVLIFVDWLGKLC